MKTYEGTAVQFHAFLISVLDGDEWSLFFFFFLGATALGGPWPPQEWSALNPRKKETPECIV
jgi:hypothetical protein